MNRKNKDSNLKTVIIHKTNRDEKKALLTSGTKENKITTVTGEKQKATHTRNLDLDEEREDGSKPNKEVHKLKICLKLVQTCCINILMSGCEQTFVG